MKIRDSFVMREIAGEYVVIPVDDSVLKANVLITVNETGAFLWRLLEKGAQPGELVSALCAEYEIDADTARRDAQDFVDYLNSRGVVIE